MITPLPRAGAILVAWQMYDEGLAEPFVRDEHDDYWSVCADIGEEVCPVQKHTTDGWVAAIFHRNEGHIRIAGQGERYVMRNGGALISRVERHGVRWNFADHPP